MPAPLILAGAALGMSAISAGAGILGANSQAKMVRARAREEARRLRGEHARTLSETAALGGEGSGVTTDSASLTKYTEGMAAEFAKEEALVLKTGMQAAGAMQTAGAFQAVGDLGGALFSFGQSQNWFKTPAVK